MKKLNKRSVFSFVLAVMLVFTVGFYSSAEPTTAWFTAFKDASNEFDMDRIVIETNFEDETETMMFDAGTRFADADERSNMFEHACKFFTIELTNVSDRDAYAFIDLVDSSQSRTASVDNGVRYFIYEYNDKTEYTDVIEVVPGVYENADGKRVIEENGKYFRTDKMIADILTEKIGDRQDEISAMSGEEQRTFLAAQASSEVKLTKNEPRKFCVAVWVEYDYFLNNAQLDEATGVRTLECNIDVVVNAVQADHYPVVEESSAA